VSTAPANSQSSAARTRRHRERRRQGTRCVTVDVNPNELDALVVRGLGHPDRHVRGRRHRGRGHHHDPRPHPVSQRRAWISRRGILFGSLGRHGDSRRVSRREVIQLISPPLKPRTGLPAE
jgi:hypothetical protein